MGHLSPSRSAPDLPGRHLWRKLFGVNLVSDIHERACDLGLSVPVGAKRRRRIERVREAGLLFVHVPKAAGMSISAALYGEQIKHASIRLHRRLDPALRTMPSFAVMRDPAERFLSAYRYGRAGGSSNNDVAEPFRSRYMAFRSIDQALNHVEAATGPYAVDHIFRAQSWYVTDRHGRVAVDQLIAIDDLAELPALVAGFPACRLPALNRSRPFDVPRLNADQLVRLRRIYADDYALWEDVTRRSLRPRRTGAPAFAAPLEIAI